MVDGKRRLVLFIVNGRYHPGEDRQLDENVMVFRVVTPLARAMHNCNLKLLLTSCLPVWQSVRVPLSPWLGRSWRWLTSRFHLDRGIVYSWQVYDALVSICGTLSLALLIKSSAAVLPQFWLRFERTDSVVDSDARYSAPHTHWIVFPAAHPDFNFTIPCHRINYIYPFNSQQIFGPITPVVPYYAGFFASIFAAKQTLIYSFVPTHKHPQGGLI